MFWRMRHMMWQCSLLCHHISSLLIAFLCCNKRISMVCCWGKFGVFWRPLCGPVCELHRKIVVRARRIWCFYVDTSLKVANDAVWKGRQLDEKANLKRTDEGKNWSTWWGVQCRIQRERAVIYARCWWTNLYFIFLLLFLVCLSSNDGARQLFIGGEKWGKRGCTWRR